MRKTTYLSTFLLLFIVFAAKSQDFKSGIRLGINAAQIDGDGMGGFNKLGAVGGLFVRYDFTERVSGQFEMLYSGKGSKRVIYEDLGFASPGFWEDLRLHYIEVPVLVNIKVIPKVAIQAGLGGGYLFSSKLEPLIGPVQKADFLRKYEVNITGGATYQFSPKLAGFARYTNSILSLSNTIKDPTRPFSYLGSKISLIASFGINYHFIAEDETLKKIKLP
ncbi:MAG: PorT family protein [Sphingobacteriales bacterium]|nr:MAG: PorT family protein [Sphingobacteriales bacterium]